MEYGQDGSLESRLYLTGAGKDDTGRLVFLLAFFDDDDDDDDNDDDDDDDADDDDDDVDDHDL